MYVRKLENKAIVDLGSRKFVYPLDTSFISDLEERFIEKLKAAGWSVRKIVFLKLNYACYYTCLSAFCGFPGSHGITGFLGNSTKGRQKCFESKKSILGCQRAFQRRASVASHSPCSKASFTDHMNARPRKKAAKDERDLLGSGCLWSSGMRSEADT